MDVYIVGEDDACKAMIRRVIAFCNMSRNVTIKIIQELPARSSEIKNKIKNFNILSTTIPVILLMDLDDNGCPPSFINTLLGGDSKNDNFMLSIAVDEVEAWLLADREGFSRYFGVDIVYMPQVSKIKMQGMVEKMEIVCPCKTSLYFTTQILPHSHSKNLIKQLTPRPGAAKGPEYNAVMVPYIENHWNIEAAKENSDSLTAMINRILRLIDNLVTQPPAKSC